MQLEVNSSQLGVYRVPLIYIFAPNEAVFDYYIRRTGVAISHVVHVRYGGGLGGGGKSSGAWLLDILDHTDTQVWISDNHLEEQTGDSFFMENVLRNRFKNGRDRVILKPIKTLPGYLWSDHGDVTFHMVEKKVPGIKKHTLSERLRPPKYRDTVHSILFKAFSYLFDESLLQDPSKIIYKVNKDSDLFVNACTEILHGKGFSPQNPLSDLDRGVFYKLMSLFGFERISCITDFQLHNPTACGSMDKITFISSHDGSKIDMFNFSRYHRCI